MSKPIAISLYRRVFKVVACVSKDPAATRLAEARWAEYLPAAMRIGVGEPMLSVTRRSFQEASATPESISKGFMFLREASSSLLSIELFASWSDMAAGNAKQGSVPYDLARGVALISAALELTNNNTVPGPSCGHYTPGSLRSLAVAYEKRIKAFVDKGLETEGRRRGLAATAKSLGGYTHAVAAQSGIRRSESNPEDFTMISLIQRCQGSECLLNILLMLKLQKHENLLCSFAGMDLFFPWIRVEKRKTAEPAELGGGSPVFVSWSYGAMTKAGVERSIHTTSKQWSHAQSVDDTATRKGALIILLRRQLSSSSWIERRGRPGEPKASYICKELLIQLLSL